MFWFKKREQGGLEISLQDLGRSSVEELAPSEAFERSEFGEDAGVSEDGCPQKIFKASVAGQTQDGWLFRLAGKDVEVPFSCSPDFRSSMGEDVFIQVEMCEGALFVNCSSYVEEFPEGEDVRDAVVYYVERHPVGNGGSSAGFYSPGLEDADEDSPQLFLSGELIGVIDREVFVQASSGVVRLASGRSLTQSIGEQEVIEHDLEAAQRFVGSNIIVWVGLGKDGSLHLEKFAITR